MKGAVLWLRGRRRPGREERWRRPRRTWDNAVSLLARNPGQVSNAINLLGDIRAVPFPPLTESPSVAAHLDCKLSPLRPDTHTSLTPSCTKFRSSFGVTSETFLCLGSSSKGIPFPCVPNPKSHCNPEAWSMQLHAQVDTLARKHLI